MLLLRLLFLLLLAFIAWRAWRLFFVRPSRSAPPPPLQDMVRCAFCDVHIPASSAVRDAGHAFCGEAHRQAYLARRGPE